MPWPSLNDYQEAVQNPRLCFSDPELKIGTPTLDRLGLPKPATGNFASVYQMTGGGKKWAVRCFLREITDQQHRYEEIGLHLLNSTLRCKVGFQYLSQGVRIRGQWYPALKMEWVDGQPLNTHIESILSNRDAIFRCSEKWLGLIEELTQAGVAHGDLQHGNVLVVGGDFKLIDYDGLFVPSLGGLPSNETGHPSYQHPYRGTLDYGPHLDLFSALVIYVAIASLATAPHLWQQFNNGDNILFSRDDFRSPSSSKLFAAMRQITDQRVAAGVFALEIACTSRLEDVPTIQAAIAQVGRKSRVTNIGVSPSTVVEVLPPAPGPRPGAWWLDHMETKSVPPELPRGPEHWLARAFVLVLLASLALVLLAAPYAMDVWIAAATIVGALVAAFLHTRYLALPVVIQKRDLLSRLSAALQEAKLVENQVAQLRAEWQSVGSKQAQAISAIESRQQECAKKEQSEITRVEADLQSDTRRINTQRQSLNQAEANAISRAVDDVERQFLSSQLRGISLDSASIDGIGRDAKMRLQAAGVHSASDLLGVHITQTQSGRYHKTVAVLQVAGRGSIQVPGIGPVKANALLTWKQNLEAALRRAMPRNLVAQQEATIKAQYATQRRSLDAQTSGILLAAQQRKQAIQLLYRREREGLDSQRQAVPGQFAQAREMLHKKILDTNKQLAQTTATLDQLRYQLRPYKRVTFSAYLRRVVLPTR